MSPIENPGTVKAVFSRRLSRATARWLSTLLYRNAATDVVVAPDRKSVSFRVTLAQLGSARQVILDICEEIRPDPVAVKFDHPSLHEIRHMVFHLSPKPSNDGLRAIGDRLMKVSGVKYLHWFANPDTYGAPAGRDEHACIFLHVYFKDTCSGAALRGAKQLTAVAVGFPPFDMSLLAP